jgi:5-methylthioadenosine/S-adenosylhomocysteine deaminase
VLEDPYANLVLVTSERDIEQVFVGGELKVDHGQMVQQDLPGIQREVYQRVARAAR